ncbi:MAG: hypothetical protein LBR50_08365 [Tannerella sp.]|jgi:hypothetical protein|nr:hypothetical protein [Tannerella sp.]
MMILFGINKMETTNSKKKDFDCVEMKNAIQAKIYAETKDMSYPELRAYLDRNLQNDAFWNRKGGAGSYAACACNSLISKYLPPPRVFN